MRDCEQAENARETSACQTAGTERESHGKIEKSVQGVPIMDSKGSIVMSGPQFLVIWEAWKNPMKGKPRHDVHRSPVH